MNKVLNKFGYISVEIIILTNIILLTGIGAIGKFVSNGKNTTNKSNKYANNFEYYATNEVIGTCKVWNWREGWTDTRTFPGYSYKCVDGKVMRIKLD